MEKKSKVLEKQQIAAALFSQFMNTLTISDHEKIVNQIVENCYVTRNKVYLWKGMRVSIPKIYWEKIEKIATKPIFESLNN